jgi:hypothetical protein
MKMGTNFGPCFGAGVIGVSFFGGPRGWLPFGGVGVGAGASWKPVSSRAAPAAAMYASLEIVALLPRGGV